VVRIKSTSLFEGGDTEGVSEIVSSGTVEFQENVIFLNRVAKVVKGGRHFSFCALVAVGDKKGLVGVGYGKANQVPDAIRKGVEDARKNIIRIPLLGRTIPHEVTGIFGAARVMLKPASEGTGIIAGPAVRSVVALAGVKDILTKCLGTNTALNVVKATMAGLRSLQDPAKVAERRGKPVEFILGKKLAEIYNQTRSEMLASLGQAGQQAPTVAKPAEEKPEVTAEVESKDETDEEFIEEEKPSGKRPSRRVSKTGGVSDAPKL
jgi:small subunit ribosomal protein S5